MARESIAVDVDGMPEVVRLARVVRESGTPRVLRQRGEDIAVIRPLPPPRRRPRLAKTEADYATFRSTAGGWAGLVDADKLIEQVYADREIGDRPPVEL